MVTNYEEYNVDLGDIYCDAFECVPKYYSVFPSWYVDKILDNIYPDGDRTGYMWSTGYNANGELGDNTRVNKSSPIQIGSLTQWSSSRAGSSYTAAIKTDGTLWAWGYNISGQLGNGSIANRSSPTQVGTLTNWKQVSCGEQHAGAIKTDGTLWSWGNNQYGQLGSGTVISRSSPVQIGALTNWKKSAAGGLNHTAAIKTDGTLWSWGNNQYGQLGSGTVVSRSSPVQIGALTNWKSVHCGAFHTAAIKTDGTLWTWGLNAGGQLGRLPI
jgi:alpha-tubulin suppressor-like RCC1 family protein